MTRVLTVSMLLAGTAAVLTVTRTHDALPTLLAAVAFVAVCVLISNQTAEDRTKVAPRLIVMVAPVVLASLLFADQEITRRASVTLAGACVVWLAGKYQTTRQAALILAVSSVAAPIAAGWAQRDRVIIGHTLLAAVAIVTLAYLVTPLSLWDRVRLNDEQTRARRSLLSAWASNYTTTLVTVAATYAVLSLIRWSMVGEFGLVTLYVGALILVLAVTTRSISKSVRRRREPAYHKVRLTFIIVALILTASVSGLPLQSPQSLASEPVAATPNAIGTVPNITEFTSCASVVDYLSQKDCYSEFFIKYAKYGGTEESLDLIIDLYGQEIGTIFRNHCHEVLHDVAFAESVRLGGPEKLFPYYRVTCTGGFSHGILVAYTDELGWPAILEQLPTFCRQLTTDVVASLVANGKPMNSDSWVEWACDHMLGHEVYKNSREDPVAGASLCNTWAFPDGRHTNCTAGFFMEHFLDTGRELNGWKRPTTVQEVFQLCLAVTVEVRRGCYNEVGPNILAYAGTDWPAAYTICKDNTPEKWIDQCYDSLSRMVTVYSGFDQRRMMDTCLSLRSVDLLATDVCGDSIAGALVMEVQQYDAAKQVCDEVIESEEWRERCIKRVEGVSQQIVDSGLAGSVTQ